MSQTVGGLGNVFIAAGTTQNWNVTWNNSGWQGNTLLEAQPFNTGAKLVLLGGIGFLE